MELAPFQVIVGANGSGKSNLFDALQLLGRLAEKSLREAFQDLRGEPDEVSTNSSIDTPTTKMHLAVEMLVNPTIKDDLEREETLRSRRLRYEVEIERGLNESNFEQLQVVFESLTSIPSVNDSWVQKYLLSANKEEPPKEEQSISADTRAFIVTELFSLKNPHIQLMPDGRGTHFSVPGGIFKNTALQSVKNTEYPHVFAAREELRSLWFFHLNPAMLRQPSSTKAPQTLASDGKNIAATLFRMQREDKFALSRMVVSFAHN